MDFSSCYTFRPQKTDHATRWISAPVTPSDHKKRITPRCSSFVHTESGATISIVSQRKAKLCDDAETFHKRIQRCYLLACVPRKQYRKHTKNYNTCADTYWLTLVYIYIFGTWIWLFIYISMYGVYLPILKLIFCNFIQNQSRWIAVCISCNAIQIVR